MLNCPKIIYVKYAKLLINELHKYISLLINELHKYISCIHCLTVHKRMKQSFSILKTFIFSFIWNMTNISSNILTTFLLQYITWIYNTTTM